MFGYVLQDWITVRGNVPATGSPDIIQGESTWMGFSSFQDVVIWLDVREITFPAGGSTVSWYFETSPSKDSNLFTPMPTPTSVVTLNNTYTPGVQTLTKVILSNASTTSPLATWVRWRLTCNGTSGNTWDATFRILIAANRVVREAPQLF